MSAVELNLDGLVGPTHHFAGLARGNLASLEHAGRTANPRAAALQGLEKMRTVAELGVPQAVLPPHERPCLALLRALGFTGDDARVLRRAAREAPRMLAAASSAAAMWTANAATVTAAADSDDGRVHFTPANLVSQLHRSIEPPITAAVLQAVFPEGRHFRHHPPLPATSALGDEGAANHTRLVGAAANAGVALFVYGRDAHHGPRRFPARQTHAACEAVARGHGLDPDRAVMARQDPSAIDAGVFHNDVIAVGHGRVLFAHERAFAERETVLARLRTALPELAYWEVPEAAVPLAEAVETYLFNSQILSGDAGLILLLPAECARSVTVSTYLAEAAERADWPFAHVRYIELGESMRNGGGPACLRLRVPITSSELAGMNPAVRLDDALYWDLLDWVWRHYRDRLAPADLADPALVDEGRVALDELTQRLGIGSVYRFQRVGA